MTEDFFKAPILNSPYQYPAKQSELQLTNRFARREGDRAREEEPRNAPSLGGFLDRHCADDILAINIQSRSRVTQR